MTLPLTGLNMFWRNEEIQVLDEVTSIWESAKVLSVVSDWSIKVKWINWPSSYSRDGVLITVPENLRQLPASCWNVRKSLKKNEAGESRSRRRGAQQHAADGNIPFTGKPAKLTRLVEVQF